MAYSVKVVDTLYGEDSTDYGEFTEYSAAAAEKQRLLDEIADEGAEGLYVEIKEIH